MSHPSLVERITRSLAYMLRHQPEQFDLELDEYGYAGLEEVVAALNERLGEPVEVEDVVQAIEGGDRPRYEIHEGRIRALYGHSIQVKPGEPAKPPPLLYVGISTADADRARRYGLRPGRRSFLHLALTAEDALETGRRASRDYVVITVNALDAWEEGINFYDRKSLFLADPIPTHFLQVGDVQTDGYGEEWEGQPGERPQRGEPPRRETRHDRPPQAERQVRPERPGRSERPDHPERTDRPERSDRPERADRPERPDRAFDPAAVESPRRAERTGSPGSRGGGRGWDRQGRSEPRRDPRRDSRSQSGPPREDRHPSRQPRDDRPERREPRSPAPARAREPDPSRPRPEPASATSSAQPGFGLGVFEAARREEAAAPKTPPPRPRERPPEEKASEPARERTDGGQFGAGI